MKSIDGRKLPEEVERLKQEGFLVEPEALFTILSMRALQRSDEMAWCRLEDGYTYVRPVSTETQENIYLWYTNPELTRPHDQAWTLIGWRRPK